MGHGNSPKGKVDLSMAVFMGKVVDTSVRERENYVS
jgi:hypothetical protein